MFPPLLLIGKVNPWRVLGIGAIVAIVLMALYVKQLSLQFQRDQVVFKNPAVSRKEWVTRVEGVIKITTKKTTTPDGRVEEVREEVRGEVRETRGTETISTPVFAPKTYTRFVGVQKIGLGSLETRDVAVYGGLTMFGRLDLGGGFTGQFRPVLCVSWRF